MASLPHHKNRVIYDDITINRVDGVAKTLDINLKLYVEDTMVEKTVKYNDENGDEQTYQDWNYETSPIVATRHVSYNIPTDDQTALSKGTTHPHNATNELEFQGKWNNWVAGYRETVDYKSAIEQLENLVL